MTIRWEKFAGRTDRFALRVSVLDDPDDGVGSSPEESASWGTFEMWVDGRNLCSHIDQGETLSAAHWYLLPIMEWIATNWNALLHEEKLPIRNSADSGAAALALTREAPVLANEDDLLAWEQEWFDWRSRHALRTARNGGLLPNVVIRRLRDYVEVSWNDEPDAGSPRGFGWTAARGAALLRPRDVAEPMYEVLAAFVDFLSAQTATSPRVEAVRDRLAELIGPDEAEERSSWLAGVDGTPSTPADGVRSGWRVIVSELSRPLRADASAAALETDASTLVVDGSSVAALMFASVSPTIAADDVRTLSALLLDQYSPDASRGVLADLSDDVLLEEGVPAWEQGYELAEALHEELELDLSAGWVDIDGLVDRMGVQSVERELVDRDIRALSVFGPRHRPTIVHNRRSRLADSPTARRFATAHELCHLLYDRAEGARLAIANGPWAPRGVERRANAFAAMLLMPADLVASTAASLTSPISNVGGIAELASAMRVSRGAAIQHVYNLTLMSETDRDELLRAAPD